MKRPVIMAEVKLQYIKNSSWLAKLSSEVDPAWSSERVNLPPVNEQTKIM